MDQQVISEEDTSPKKGFTSDCSLHPGADVNYYCETCKKAVCSLCAPGHSSHILFNLTAVANTISEQLNAAATARDTYKQVLERYEKAETSLVATENVLKAKVSSLLEFIQREMSDWLARYTKPVSQLLADVRRKREETQHLLLSVETILAEKAGIQAEIQHALADKQYSKIYKRKKAMVAASLSEAQLAALKEKAVGIEKKLDAAIKNELNTEEIKSSISKFVEKLRAAEWKKLSVSAVFNLSAKAARAEIIEVTHRRHIGVNLGLNIEGYDAVLMAGDLYIIGGMDAGGQYLKSCVAFDVTTGSETIKGTQMAEMSIERVAHTIQDVCKKYIYCVGGYNPPLKYLKQCEKFAVHLNRWLAVPSLNEHKSQVAMCLLEDRYLYLFGGSIGPSKWLKTIEVLDLNKEYRGWKMVKYVNQDEKWAGSYCAGCLPISPTQILLFGGMRQDKLDECFLFDQTSIQQLDQDLDCGASFYQRKPRLVSGSVYAGSLHSDLHVQEMTPLGEWKKYKMAEYAEQSDI